MCSCHLLNAIVILFHLPFRVEGIIEVCILAFLAVVLENLTIRLIRAFPLFFDSIRMFPLRLSKKRMFPLDIAYLVKND